MKAVIAGAGTSGRKISSYLINAGYEVIFIDYNLTTIREVTDSEGLAGIHGQCTSIETMRNVDVGSADLFIGITSVDEINILGCEVAHYLGASTKIARINNHNYLTEDWLNNMYDPKNIPINSIIAINLILAKDIIKTLTLNNQNIDKTYDFFDGKAKLISVFCNLNIKLINNSISSLQNSFFKYNLTILAINRNNTFINIENKNETIVQPDDILYILIESNYLAEFLESINTNDEVEQYYNYNYITLIGVHDAIYYITKELVQDPKVRLNVITTNKEQAQNLATSFQQISKDRLNIILTKNFENSIKNIYSRYNESFIIMHNQDRENILLSLYCKFYNLSNISTLLQDSEYEHLLSYIGINSVYVVDNYMLMPIIDEIKGPYVNKAVLIKSDIQLVQLEIVSKSIFIGKRISEININNGSIRAIAALSSANLKDGIYIRDNDLLLQEGDTVLFVVEYSYIKQAEELFNQFSS